MAHTPGPWKFVPPDREDQQECDLGSIVAGDGNIVCAFGDSTCYYNSCGEPPSGADASLIAAAPDLLEALRGAIEWMACVEGPLRDGQPFKRNLASCQAAIDKAEGRTP